MTWTFIPDILEEHLDELGFLWGMRQGDLRSPDEPFWSFLETEERIEAHLRGVLTVGDKARTLVAETVAGDDPSLVFAAALVLLHSNGGGAETVLDALEAADAERLGVLGAALAHGPLERDALDRLLARVASDDEPRAVTAAKALAFHGAMRAEQAPLQAWRTSDDPAIRRAGWRLIAYLRAETAPERYAAALRDDDPGVREAALEAAAWSGNGGALQVGRAAAMEPSPERLHALRILAALGGPPDRPIFLRLADAEALGPARYDLLGSLGDPALVDAVVDGCASEDPETALAAGRAFRKLTGVDVTGQEVVEVPPEEETAPGEADEEPIPGDPVALPDAGAARKAWDGLRERLADAPRIGWGADLRRGVDRQSFGEWDMASRWELFLRARFGGKWSGSPVQLEVYPQRRGG